MTAVPETPAAPRRLVLTLAIALAALCLAPRPSSAVWNVPTGYADQLVVGGFEFPVGMAFLPDGRMLVVEKDSARVRLVINGAIAANDPLVRVPNVRFAGFEQGLLGVAVDPGFPARPYFYVHYDYALSPNIRVSRYTLGGDLDFAGNGELTCDPASRYDVLTDLIDVNDHHNGGTLRFGPDGMLYVSIGEDDVPCNAQNLDLALGAILRIDVSQLPAGGGGPPAKALITPADNPWVADSDPDARLVWAHGMRNPFRFTIDPTDGTLYVGEVGNYGEEEVDIVEQGGLNFGWPAFEGFNYSFFTCGADTTGMVRPAYVYVRDSPEVGAAITGSAIIRNTSMELPHFPPGYEGDVFITDVYAGWLRRLKRVGDHFEVPPPVAGQTDPLNWAAATNPFVTDLQQGPDGALYYVQVYGVASGQTPSVRRIVRTSLLDVAPVATTDVAFAAPWPSPARGLVRFAFTLPRAASVSLSQHDVHGRRVRELSAARALAAGPHELTWDTADRGNEPLGTGVYFARLTVDGISHVRRITVLR